MKALEAFGLSIMSQVFVILSYFIILDRKNLSPPAFRPLIASVSGSHAKQGNSPAYFAKSAHVFVEVETPAYKTGVIEFCSRAGYFFVAACQLFVYRTSSSHVQNLAMRAIVAIHSLSRIPDHFSHLRRAQFKYFSQILP